MTHAISIYSATRALRLPELQRYADWEGWQIRFVDVLDRPIPERFLDWAPPGIYGVFGWPSSDPETMADVDRTLREEDVEAIRRLMANWHVPRVAFCSLSFLELPTDDSFIQPGREEDFLCLPPGARKDRARTRYTITTYSIDDETTRLREMLDQQVRCASNGVGDEPASDLRR
ncbi:hypothetical protein [Paludisphaera mucosa]|uniref:Transcriptional regulator n=1 Tax=Paludisphaera mucosa TaxID=3030827 RepID=A0ABT6FFG8_9BACT|nr:hypothetical protein [Paludisphaera mucosa]MDG3006309.1 hypothetical protein [Paludisphaera mucosa]